MTKTRSVLPHAGHSEDDGMEVFMCPPEPDPADQGRERVVKLANADWVDLGSPDTITVTVEPGDLLND